MPRQCFPRTDCSQAARSKWLLRTASRVSLACREASVVDASYHLCRKEYGGLQLDQARRLKELERENARLKRVVADLSLKKATLNEVTSGNF